MKEQVLTINLREILKEIMQKEIEMLPELLNQLETRERLNIVCKLMPYIFPKAESVHFQSGEPMQLDVW